MELGIQSWLFLHSFIHSFFLLFLSVSPLLLVNSKFCRGFFRLNYCDKSMREMWIILEGLRVVLAGRLELSQTDGWPEMAAHHSAENGSSLLPPRPVVHVTRPESRSGGGFAGGSSGRIAALGWKVDGIGRFSCDSVCWIVLIHFWGLCSFPVSLAHSSNNFVHYVFLSSLPAPSLSFVLSTFFVFLCWARERFNNLSGSCSLDTSIPC